jgi:undecaprenyl diphosphate synthase
VARDAAAGTLRPEDLDVDRFTGYLPTAKLPPLDLLIRTSGEQRISNYLLWQLAYAEFVFRDELWPDFSREAFEASLDEYDARQRRFGAR